jgi:hypothetical protein
MCAIVQTTATTAQTVAAIDVTFARTGHRLRHRSWIMKRTLPQSEQSQGGSANADDSPSVPPDVFYVVQTTAALTGKRRHRVCLPLYERPRRAQIELVLLQTASSGSGTYSIWKATTHGEPAEWLYDVVVTAGSVIRLRGPRPAPVSSEDSPATQRSS